MSRPKKKLIAAPCVVKRHFSCDGSGTICGTCGESEPCCGCEGDGDVPHHEKCEDCDGTGRFCVEHNSACGSLASPPVCDGAAKTGGAS